MSLNVKTEIQKSILLQITKIKSKRSLFYSKFHSHVGVAVKGAAKGSYSFKINNYKIK